MGLVTDQGEAFTFGVAGSAASGVVNRAYFYQNLNAPLIFGTSGTDRMTIDGSGNVGIGSTAPRSLLEIDKGTGTAQITIDGTTGACLMLQDTDGAGWTECDALNGTLSCSTDADGVCD